MFPLWPQWAGRAAGWRGSGQSLGLALVPPLSPLHVPLSQAQAAAVAGTGTPLAEGTPPSVHVCFYGHCCERTGVVLLLASRSRRAPSGRKPVGVAGQRSGSASWARQLVAPCACGDVPSLGTVIQDCDCSALGLKQGSPGPPRTLRTEGPRPGRPRRPCPGHTAPAPAARQGATPGQCP